MKPETKLENTKITEQESEYDSTSDKEGDQLVDEQPAKEAKTNEVAVNFLSKTFCTRSELSTNRAQFVVLLMKLRTVQLLKSLRQLSLGEIPRPLFLNDTKKKLILCEEHVILTHYMSLKTFFPHSKLP